MDVALRILAGTPPGQIRTPVQRPGDPVFDWRELRRWGIAEDRLPPGSVVLFREPTAWERHKRAIVGGAAALLAQSLLIAGLLVNRFQRRRAERSLREDLRPWMLAMAAAVRAGLAGLTRVRVEGAIDEIPREGPVIIASNHASNLDVPVLGSSLMPKTGRRFQWLGKKELFSWPIVGVIADAGGVHPVDRSSADVEA